MLEIIFHFYVNWDIDCLSYIMLSTYGKRGAKWLMFDDMWEARF